MKPKLLNRSNLQNNSFAISYNSYPYFLKVWHYHTELELVVLLESTGTRFIGDSVEKFDKGEIVLIGKNLPHMWLNDDKYFEESSTLKAEAIAIHFKEGFLGDNFFQNPEMKRILDLLDRASYGIKFEEKNAKIIEKIKELLSTGDDFKKVIQFLEILNDLSQCKNYKLLSSTGFVDTFKKSDNKNLYKPYEYIFNNFNKSISLNDVAEIANMNPSSFSRFFKRVNRKTFSRYLNEIRIGYACKLLIENKYSITVICYESGFNNVSNFNRQFKTITGFSPTEYLKKHI
ncbi:AraC family transcriptional regulator [Flavivirga spongiicola]|uniref:AraC family transcriptional regulator n=1 Tax=Flavivirga spongiicola TaxID=421621 RepID=A0ABU7XNX8_9FLAO|nr:AraC family transcriptional regulator [Flavivirga sp. MEBiC05379]MDO5977480.1 AraC family transcriptional regulator [Flavivirga sp. MEBiC05379]